jgi:hypothetical protein
MQTVSQCERREPFADGEQISQAVLTVPEHQRENARAPGR